MKENVDRILTEQADYILELCGNGPLEMDQAIHEIRKSIKRIRAVFRLIREEIGYSTYYRENVFYRDINRGISDLRTFDVLIPTLENLRTGLSGTLPEKDMDPMIRSIRDQRERIASNVFSSHAPLAEIASSIREAKSRVPDLPIRQDGFEVFAGGILRTYRKGKEYLKSATGDQDLSHLHDMRKRMKYLWHQIQILKPIYPGALGALTRSLETVSEKLGIYHDLEVLSEYLKENAAKIGDETRRVLLETCEFKKYALLPSTFRKAGIAFGEEPESLVARLGEYWKVYYGQT